MKRLIATLAFTIAGTGAASAQCCPTGGYGYVAAPTYGYTAGCPTYGYSSYGYAAAPYYGYGYAPSYGYRVVGYAYRPRVVHHHGYGYGRGWGRRW